LKKKLKSKKRIEKWRERIPQRSGKRRTLEKNKKNAGTRKPKKANATTNRVNRKEYFNEDEKYVP
jgi:hypothetical protein